MNNMASDFRFQVSGFGLSRRRWSAFTLIELLVVIAIISLLAAMIIPITGAVNRQKFKTKARTELTQIETAIENYKTKIGHYPPDNPGRPSTNQLYYELLGVVLTNNAGGPPIYRTLDGSSEIPLSLLGTVFGVGAGGPNVAGFANCTQGTTDEARSATPFLQQLKVNQSGQPFPPPPLSPFNLVRFLVSSIPWDRPGQTWTLGVAGLNPICYNSSNPTNNPQSYDLWIDVIIGGKTNRICNWSKDPIVVYSYPNAVQE